MKKQDIDLILEICQEVDLLVSQDIGTADLDVLEQSRIKMNDLLYKQRYRDAEIMAYAITLMRSGNAADAYLLKQTIGSG